MKNLLSNPSAAENKNPAFQTKTRGLIAGVALAALWAGPSLAATIFNDGVYAATNRFDGNTIAAFRSNADGTLDPIAEYATGGLGGIFDAGEGLDPLISEDSVLTSTTSSCSW